MSALDEKLPHPRVCLGLAIWKSFIHTDALELRPRVRPGAAQRDNFRMRRPLGLFELRWIQINKKWSQIGLPENFMCKMLRVAEFYPWPLHHQHICEPGVLWGSWSSAAQHSQLAPRGPWLHASGVYVHRANPGMQPFQKMPIGAGGGKLPPCLENWKS